MKIPIFVAAAVFAGFAATQNSASTGVVEGTVVNSAMGVGVSGASVVLSGGEPAPHEATTDAARYFQIAGIAPGRYITSVSKDGFAPLGPDFLFSADPGLRIVSGRDPVKVEPKLSPLNSIFGRVFGPDGKPALGVELDLYPNLYADMVVTDAEGRFAYENIRPGSYLLLARPPKSAKSEQAKDGTRTAMVTTYYPSVADRSLAQEIVFRGQGDYGGAYEIRMQTAPVHSVRGIVLDEDRRPSPQSPIRSSMPKRVAASLRGEPPPSLLAGAMSMTCKFTSPDRST
jgi:hypothetical protein